MNSMGVTLAADSAVTITGGDSDKIHNSANKLFMLSKRYPVGVMIYNNASLLGIPWETIIKMFRQSLGERCFKTLEEYGQEMISYLENNDDLFPVETQKEYYLQSLGAVFRKIYNAGKNKFLDELMYDLQADEEELRHQMTTFVKEAIQQESRVLE